MRKTNGEPYTGRLVRTVRGQALGNLPSQDGKAPSAEPTLYEYIGCATPFDRLWISSLTDKAIREGLKNLECGSKYDNLYYAAKARSEADWLVGINATQAITLAAGRGTYSLGRVQTPTLAMVCKRFWENKRFTPETFHQLHFGTEHKDGTVVKFDSDEKYKDKAVAEELYNKVKGTRSATLTKVVRKEKVEDTPLLYDLTTLQKDANSKHGFTAEQTLAIAQKLYEAKLITYPRTGSRYISEDVFAEIPKLLQTLKNRPVWSLYALSIKKPTRRSVDGSKVTDHHAIIITGELPKHMSNGGYDHLRYDCRSYAGSLFREVHQGCNPSDCRLLRYHLYRQRLGNQEGGLAIYLWCGQERCAAACRLE